MKNNFHPWKNYKHEEQTSGHPSGWWTGQNPNHQKPMTHPRIQFFVISNKGLEGLG